MAKTTKPTKIAIELTSKRIAELINIIDVCQAHLQDYDLDGEIEDNDGYYETNKDCDVWLTKLEKLKKKVK